MIISAPCYSARTLHGPEIYRTSPLWVSKAGDEVEKCPEAAAVAGGEEKRPTALLCSVLTPDVPSSPTHLPRAQVQLSPVRQVLLERAKGPQGYRV